mmetsp:Transcript_16277/g.41031  ORF Transcript_16277/g.41031 Transcript_16277/m.41031 type:complete len:154 (+) Transcript_16277:248-709(+)
MAHDPAKAPQSTCGQCYTIDRSKSSKSFSFSCPPRRVALARDCDRGRGDPVGNLFDSPPLLLLDWREHTGDLEVASKLELCDPAPVTEFEAGRKISANCFSPATKVGFRGRSSPDADKSEVLNSEPSSKGKAGKPEPSGSTICTIVGVLCRTA